VFHEAVEAVHRRLASIEGVAAVGPPTISADGHTAVVAVSLRGDQSAQIATAANLARGAEAAAPTGFQVAIGGRAALYDSVNDISKHDLEQAELIALPITALILVVAFGGLVAAALPLLLGSASLVVTLGGLFLLSYRMGLSSYVTNTASIIGIGVGIDYALFMVTRYREERQCGHQVDVAVLRTMASSGRAVVLSGLTVVVGLSGLFVVDIQSFRSMAVGCVTVVALAVVAAVTLLPALLSLAGPRLDRVRTRRARRDGAGVWHAWAMLVMRRPLAVLAAAAAVLTVLTLPALSLHLGQPSARTLPAGSGPRDALDRIAIDFAPGATGPVEILVRTPAGATTPAGTARLERLERLLREYPGVVAARSIADLSGARRAEAGTAGGLVSRNGRLARVTVIGRALPQSDAGQALVRRIRDRILPAAGLEQAAIVGGPGAEDLDLTAAIGRSVPWVIATVLALSLLLLTVTLRSLLLPLKAVAMNLLSVGAASGIVVAVFQWGFGSHVLGFTPEGQIQAFVPLFLFCVLFGLSMDYEIFLLTRIREEFARSRDTRSAVATGLERTGRTITSAALIMVVIFAAFAGNRLLAFKAIGLGLAAAILVDATLIRLLVVPATMRLLGRWNWWFPERLARWLGPGRRVRAAADRSAATPEAA
jgi:RND superfamily putative drug exporter